ncbi:MAG: hypothetical protein ACK5G7_06030 [Erysipelotrichaceae bacterium]
MKVMLVNNLSSHLGAEELNKIFKQNNIIAEIDLSKRKVMIINNNDIHLCVELLSDLGYEVALF